MPKFSQLQELEVRFNFKSMSASPNRVSTTGDAGRPHLESPDDAQLGLYQALRGGDEGVGRQIDLHAGGTRSFFSATMSPFCLSQDILDAWLRCQESWLYLEPIFNSEDIMKQMPVEGRKFNKVDRIWRNIMAKTVSDTRVLQATSQPNMLVSP